MILQIFPVLIGNERFEPAEQDVGNPGWVAALQRQHLRKTSFCLCTGGAGQPIVIKLYGRDTDRPHYGLARTQDTGLNHDPDCRFFADGADTSADKDTLPAFETVEGDKVRAHLAFSLQLADPQEPTPGPAPAARRQSAGPSRNRASESAMLFRLWREAGLNVYRGEARKWYKVAYALLQTAKKIVINPKGESLADYLLIAAKSRDKFVTTHNQSVLKRVTDSPSRLIVIGRMHAVDTSNGRKKLLPLVDAEDQPRALIPSLTIDNLLARRPLIGNLLDKSIQGNVIMMTCVEPENDPWWRVHSSAFMPTSPQFIPAESSYELEFEDHLVSEGRHFVKPIALNELGENDQRPDYVLLDTFPRVRCEVWGMQTPEYLAGKAKRLADYASKGQRLVSWSANPHEPFPVLPPAANKE